MSIGVLLVSAPRASAQTDPAQTAYLMDSRGAVVRSTFGLCWHTTFGPATYNAECDPAPIKVADATPPPPPPPAVASPKPAGGKVTLDADTLFDFDKAVLRPEGKQALDEFLEKAKGINPEVIIAVGHADRFGSEAYNQTLSEKRAAAVKNYMVNKGIDANRIHTEMAGDVGHFAERAYRPRADGETDRTTHPARSRARPRPGG